MLSHRIAIGRRIDNRLFTDLSPRCNTFLGPRRESAIMTVPLEAASASAPDTTDKAPARVLTTTTLVVIVVATAAPLGVIATAPIILALTGTVLLPLCYIAAAVLYFLFAVGFTRMSRYVGSAGAFYDYVRRGLGRIPGVGASTLALGVYALAGISTTAYLGAAITNMVTAYTGVAIPWWVWAILAVGVIGFLGYREIEASTRVLGALVAIEIVLIIIIDSAVIFQGGAAGLDLMPFGVGSPEGGSLPLGLMYAFTGFYGIEATALYRAETKNPDRAIPRATFISIGVIGVFYALSIWAMIEGSGSSTAVASAQTDPINFLLDLAGTFVAPIFRDIVQILVLTSTFACALSFHNVVTRYVASLSKRSILPAQIGQLHPRFRTPSRASLAQSAFVLLMMVLIIVTGLDPVLEVGAWFSGAVSLGMLLLLAVTCVSVIVFFRKSKVETALWPTVIAPTLGFVGLLATIVLVLANFSLLTGDAFSASLVAIGVLALFVVGVLVALRMRKSRPERYEALRS
jgi:amino acid transporter